MTWRTGLAKPNPGLRISMNPSERLCEQLNDTKCMYSLLEAKLGTGDVLLFHGFANGSRPIPFFRSWRPQFNATVFSCLPGRTHQKLRRKPLQLLRSRRFWPFMPSLEMTCAWSSPRNQQMKSLMWSLQPQWWSLAWRSSSIPLESKGSLILLIILLYSNLRDLTLPIFWDDATFPDDGMHQFRFLLLLHYWNDKGICAASSFGSMLVQLSPWSWTWPTYGGQGNNVNSGFSEACCYDHQSKGSNVRRLTFWYHSPNRFMNVLAPFKEEGW